MRFTIEQRHLTDDNGKPVPQTPVSFHTFDAESVDDAVRLFIRKTDSQVLGEVLKFPGFQAVATVRGTTGVFTVQVSPATS